MEANVFGWARNSRYSGGAMQAVSLTLRKLIHTLRVGQRCGVETTREARDLHPFTVYTVGLGAVLPGNAHLSGINTRQDIPGGA